jgi:hypothetical protein
MQILCSYQCPNPKNGPDYANIHNNNRMSSVLSFVVTGQSTMIWCLLSRLESSVLKMSVYDHTSTTCLYSTAWQFMHLDVQDFELSWPPICLHCCDLPHLIPTNQNEKMWLLSQLPIFFCYWADHSQLSQAPYFIKWGQLPLCFVKWDSSPIN